MRTSAVARGLRTKNSPMIMFSRPACMVRLISNRCPGFHRLSRRCAIVSPTTPSVVAWSTKKKKTMATKTPRGFPSHALIMTTTGKHTAKGYLWSSRQARAGTVEAGTTRIRERARHAAGHGGPQPRTSIRYSTWQLFVLRLWWHNNSSACTSPFVRRAERHGARVTTTAGISSGSWFAFLPRLGDSLCSLQFHDPKILPIHIPPARIDSTLFEPRTKYRST